MSSCAFAVVMSLIQSVKLFGGGNSPGHVGVIQMAMGVDQAGQQDDSPRS